MVTTLLLVHLLNLLHVSGMAGKWVVATTLLLLHLLHVLHVLGMAGKWVVATTTKG